MSASPQSRVFVSTTFAADDTPIAEVLAACNVGGLRNVELGSNHPYEPDPVAAVNRHRPVRCLVHNYFPPPEESLVVNIASLDDDVRRRSLEHVERSLAYCARIGALLYTVHPGFLSDPRGASRGAGTYDFLFAEDAVPADVYNRAYDRMLAGLEWVVERARAHRVRLAVETEGSVTKRGLLLLQRPEEYDRVLAAFSPADLGINLNIGHLRLAERAFGFTWRQFVDRVVDYVIAMELSHNEGATDDHRPLQAGAWYWDLIADPRFADAYRILEFRNTPVADVAACADMVARCLAV